MATSFEGETSLCRLYSNINGTSTGEEDDFSMVKREIGVCESIISIIFISELYTVFHIHIFGLFRMDNFNGLFTLHGPRSG